jgi:hypothetical protein
MMDRRAFIGTAAVGALLLSARADAQRAEKLPRVALLFNETPVAEMPAHRFVRAFVDGLRDLGLVEGRTAGTAGRRDRDDRTSGLGSEASDRHDSDRGRGHR